MATNQNSSAGKRTGGSPSLTKRFGIRNKTSTFYPSLPLSDSAKEGRKSLQNSSEIGSEPTVLIDWVKSPSESDGEATNPFSPKAESSGINGSNGIASTEFDGPKIRSSTYSETSSDNSDENELEESVKSDKKLGSKSSFFLRRMDMTPIMPRRKGTIKSPAGSPELTVKKGRGEGKVNRQVTIRRRQQQNEQDPSAKLRVPSSLPIEKNSNVVSKESGHAQVVPPSPTKLSIRAEDKRASSIREISAEEKIMIKRRNIVQEIVGHQENYVNALKRLQDLQASIGNLKSRDEVFAKLDGLLKTVGGILKAHEEKTKLLDSLQKRAVNYDRDQVISGPIESSFSNYDMKTSYKNYVLEHSQCQMILKAYRANNIVFDNFLTKFEEKYADKLNVEALLMKPIQILPQIILILQRLLSSCGIGHKDRQGLQRAVLAVEQLAGDLNDLKGSNDLKRQIESIRENYAKTHKSGAVDSIITKDQISECARRDEVKVSMVSPHSSSVTDGYILLFPRRLVLLGSKKTDRGDRLLGLLTSAIEDVVCIGHEIFFKAGKCDSVDVELVEDWQGVLEDGAKLQSLKNGIEQLNREYKNFNVSHVMSALKEHQAVSKDVIQSIKAAGCVDVFFSATPDHSVEMDSILDARPATSPILLSQWKLTFGSKEEASSWKTTLRMLQMANSFKHAAVSVKSALERSNKLRSGGNSSFDLENSMSGVPRMSGVKSPLFERKAKKESTSEKPTSKESINSSTSQGSGNSELIGCWIRTEFEKTSIEKYLSVPLLYCINEMNHFEMMSSRIALDGGEDQTKTSTTESFLNLFEDEPPKVVCAVPLSNSPSICPLSLDQNLALNLKNDKVHAEVLSCYGLVWVIYSSQNAFFVSVLSICESGTIHTIEGSHRQFLCCGKMEAFCAVAVPGLDIDESFIDWVSQQLEKEGKNSNRPKVLNQQSVWIGTDKGIIVYKVANKTGLGSRVFSLPTEHAVHSIQYAGGRVIAGLDTSNVYIYTRSSAESTYGAWNRTPIIIDLKIKDFNPFTSPIQSPTSPQGRRHKIRNADCSSGFNIEEEEEDEEEDEEVSLGRISGPVTCIVLPFNDPFKPNEEVDVAWCSVANSIYILSISQKKVLHKIDLQILRNVEAMACAGVSVVVACKLNRTLEMYHAETYQQLSIISLEKSINAFCKVAPTDANTEDLPMKKSKSGTNSPIGGSSRRASKDPKSRLISDLGSPSALRAGSGSGCRRFSTLLNNFHPCTMAVHSGNLWVGTSTGHLIRFQISKIGLIPNVREPKISVYYFSDQPVKTIIFTGQRYQATYQKVVMSEKDGADGAKSKKLGNRKGGNLDARKLSIYDSKGSDDLRGNFRSRSTLYLAGDEEKENEDGGNVNGEEEDNRLSKESTDSIQRDRSQAMALGDSKVDNAVYGGNEGSDSFRSDESGSKMIEAFPMLTAKPGKSISSNVLLPTYVMAIGENLTSIFNNSAEDNKNREDQSSKFSMISFQVV